MLVKPSKNNLFCKQEKAENRTSGGFFLAGNAIDEPHTAEVIEVGSAVSEYTNEDRIVYKPYSTTEFKINGEEYFLINEEDVLGKIV